MKTFTEEQMLQCYKDAVNNVGYYLLDVTKLKTAEEYVNSISKIKMESAVKTIMPNFEPTKFDRNELESIGVFPKPINKTSAEIGATIHSEFHNKIFDIPPKHINKPTEGLAVDVGCKGNPGKAEYRGVDIKTGKVLFHVHIPNSSTNNIGEWLGAVHGLKYVKENNLNMVVYSDSLTAISWVRQKKCKTKFFVIDTAQQKMIAEAEQFLRENKCSVIKWRTDLYGEIVADFGRKR